MIGWIVAFLTVSIRLNFVECVEPAFPTQILSAYGSRLGVRGGRWSGLNVGKNNEDHSDKYPTTTTIPNYNIGVIQVRLSNWTDHPLLTASTRAPNSVQRRRTSRGKQRDSRTSAPTALASRRRPNEEVDEDRSRWQPLDDEDADESSASSTFIFQSSDPRDRSRFAHVDNTYAYVIAAIFLGLVIFLTTLYLFLSCRSFCRKRQRRHPPAMTYPSPYAYYESTMNQRGGDLERLFRSDLELKRPPLIAPLRPPLPACPPPLPPVHLRTYPSYARRKITGPQNRDSPVEREIRLQMLKRQISQSTLSSRTRTNSF